MLCERSSGNSGPATAVVHVVPAKADARAQGHAHNCTKASSDLYIADGAQFS